MFVFDAHLDLSMNAMEWNRDLTFPLEVINQREEGMTDKPDRGLATVSFPEMHKGNIGLCVGTLIARVSAAGSALPGWASQEQAWAQIQGQKAWYDAMSAKGILSQVTSKESLKEHLKLWFEAKSESSPIGYILSLEGADSIINTEYLESLFNQGLRAIGLSHYGPGIHAFGTDSDGNLPKSGKALLQKASDLGIILDMTHLSDICFYEALDLFDGPLWASHHLCRHLTPHNRQLSDDMINKLIERGAPIGMALDNWMIVPNWERGISTPKSMDVTLNKVVDHLIHICSLAGSSKHVMIGSDLDGAFGTEQTPQDIQSIVDLQNFIPLLSQRGFSDREIEGLMWKNGVSFLLKNLPN